MDIHVINLGNDCLLDNFEYCSEFPDVVRRVWTEGRRANKTFTMTAELVITLELFLMLFLKKNPKRFVFHFETKK